MSAIPARTFPSTAGRRAHRHRRPMSCWRPLLTAFVAMGVAGCASSGTNDGPAVSVTGNVDSASRFTVDGLSTFPQITQAVSYLAGTSPQSHRYAGPTLWSVLDDTGIQLNPSVRNDVLNRYVLATGSDGYRVAYALGEISPDFGNRPDLIAIREITGGVPALLANDGHFRITSPGDVKGGRYVSQLDRLEVRTSGSGVTGIGGGASSSLSVSGDAALRPGSFDRTALAALPQTMLSAGGKAYTGVSLWSFVNSTIGLNVRASVKNDGLGVLIVLTGSDGYKVIVSEGEVDPSFGNQPALLALQVDGQPLGSSGFARLVMPNDVKAGRWVSNLIAVEILRVP